MEELSVLNSLIEQRDLIDKLGEEQREERVEKRNLDYAVVNKIEKLRNALPMDFLFEVGLKGAYDKKVKAKMKAIIFLIFPPINCLNNDLSLTIR